jgi:phage-related holin
LVCISGIWTIVTNVTYVISIVISLVAIAYTSTIIKTISNGIAISIKAFIDYAITVIILPIAYF